MIHIVISQTEPSCPLVFVTRPHLSLPPRRSRRLWEPFPVQRSAASDKKPLQGIEVSPWFLSRLHILRFSHIFVQAEENFHAWGNLKIWLYNLNAADLATSVQGG